MRIVWNTVVRHTMYDDRFLPVARSWRPHGLLGPFHVATHSPEQSTCRRALHPYTIPSEAREPGCETDPHTSWSHWEASLATIWPTFISDVYFGVALRTYVVTLGQTNILFPSDIHENWESVHIGRLFRGQYPEGCSINRNTCIFRFVL